jgi:4a-hydroxytetrahydrobiopterin dehydratase
MKRLAEADIRERLAALRGWSLERDGTAISREYRFGAFPAAIAFVNRVASLAEEADHHPDIDIRFDRVRLTLWTHVAGGLTRRDFDLAERIDANGQTGSPDA